MLHASQTLRVNTCWDVVASPQVRVPQKPFGTLLRVRDWAPLAGKSRGTARSSGLVIFSLEPISKRLRCSLAIQPAAFSRAARGARPAGLARASRRRSEAFVLASASGTLPRRDSRPGIVCLSAALSLLLGVDRFPSTLQFEQFSSLGIFKTQKITVHISIEISSVNRLGIR